MSLCLEAVWRTTFSEVSKSLLPSYCIYSRKFNSFLFFVGHSDSKCLQFKMHLLHIVKAGTFRLRNAFV